MQNTIKNKQILITGAGSGIGQGLAYFLAEKGHHIIVSDVNLSNANLTVSNIEKKQFSAEAIALNVTSQKDIDSLTSKLQQPIDILINNAGIQHVEAIDTFPMEKWEQLIQIMLIGTARLTQAVLPAMREQNYGRIINIGSLHALVASPFKSAYIAAKHGLIGFSKTIALEIAEQDITINTICPAYVKTPLVSKQIAAQAKEHGITEEEVINDIMLKPMPKKSFISIEELAGTCDFLISDYAKNMTAQTLVLDGGWTAQ